MAVRVRLIVQVPDTIGSSYTYTDTDTWLYKILYWKCDFVWGIGVYSLHIYAAYMRENTV